MLEEPNNKISLQVTKTKRYLLYRVKGSGIRPLRFDLISLNGRKVRSIDLLVGSEFVIPIHGLDTGEYLFAMSSTKGLIQSGVVNI